MAKWFCADNNKAGSKRTEILLCHNSTSLASHGWWTRILNFLILFTKVGDRLIRSMSMETSHQAMIIRRNLSIVDTGPSSGFVGKDALYYLLAKKSHFGALLDISRAMNHHLIFLETIGLSVQLTTCNVCVNIMFCVQTNSSADDPESYYETNLYKLFNLKLRPGN